MPNNYHLALALKQPTCIIIVTVSLPKQTNLLDAESVCCALSIAVSEFASFEKIVCHVGLKLNRVWTCQPLFKAQHKNISVTLSFAWVESWKHFCLTERLGTNVFLEINIFRVTLFYFLLQIKVKTFFSEIYFSKVSILPSFEIFITGLKTVWRLQSPVPVLLPRCWQIYLSFALVGNFYLLVQLLL